MYSGSSFTYCWYKCLRNFFCLYSCLLVIWEWEKLASTEYRHLFRFSLSALSWSLFSSGFILPKLSGSRTETKVKNRNVPLLICLNPDHIICHICHWQNINLPMLFTIRQQFSWQLRWMQLTFTPLSRDTRLFTQGHTCVNRMQGHTCVNRKPDSNNKR